MKSLRFSILIASLGMLAFMTRVEAAPRKVQIPYFNNHVQNYAPLDVSGTNYEAVFTNMYYYSPDLMALDDSNNVAFGKMSSSTNYTVYTWTNGILTTLPTISLTSPNGYGYYYYLGVSQLLPNGTMFVNELDYDGVLDAFYVTGNSDTSIPLPYPYQGGNTWSGAVASDGSYVFGAIYGSAIFDNPTNSGGFFSAISQRGKPVVVFDDDPNAYSTGGTIINNAEEINIQAINTNGWAIGWGYNQTSALPYIAGNQVWDGTSFKALNGSPSEIDYPTPFSNNDVPINLNNSNQVIVQGINTNGSNSEGYIWTEDASNNAVITQLRSLIATSNPPSSNDLVVMSQIKHIEPFAISNIRQTNATDPSNFPILNILAMANVRSVATVNPANSAFSNEIVLISQYPNQSWHFKQCLGLSQTSDGTREVGPHES